MRKVIFHGLQNTVGRRVPMVAQSPLGRLPLVLCCCVFFGLSGTPAWAESPSEKPLALTFDDPQLKWNPCPPLFPKGCEIAVLHGDPAKPNADVFFKVPANYTIPPHWHTSAERMVLVSGELHVTYSRYGARPCSSRELMRMGLPRLRTKPPAPIRGRACFSLLSNLL